MHNEIKAVVIKTPRLHETKMFYKNKLGLMIVESSRHHFVIQASGIRIVFVSVNSSLEIELYLSTSGASANHGQIEIIEDANAIRYILCSDY